jgi:hypothetical protein
MRRTQREQIFPMPPTVRTSTMRAANSQKSQRADLESLSLRFLTFDIARSGTFRFSLFCGTTAMSDLSEACPECGRPMVLLSAGSKGTRARTWKCLFCDQIDPLRSPDMERWIRGSLRPPEQ